ncbi:MAG: hypothetical protein NC548_39855 [Lachnospiraceae bacterium]|nr:hypothetical protein [Lachnospiraceae bacterium]
MLEAVLFTHDDMDGSGCRIVFSLAYQQVPEDRWKVFNCTNSSIDDDVRNFIWNDKNHDANTIICFADICCSCSTMEMLMKEFENIMVWDHHATNFPITNVLPTAVIMPKNPLGKMESGTSLMYKFFAENAVTYPKDPRAYWFTHGDHDLLLDLVDTIRSYDTYEWKETNNMKAKELQTLFWLLGMERFCNRYINMILGKQPGSNGSLFCVTDKDFIEAKLENEQRAIDRFDMDKVYPVYVRGYSCAFAVSTLGANISELGYQFLHAHPEFDLFIQYSLQTNTFQIRAIREDLDTGAVIAAPLGGGGHAPASGATLDPEVKEEIIDLLVNFLNKGYN